MPNDLDIITQLGKELGVELIEFEAYPADMPPGSIGYTIDSDQNVVGLSIEERELEAFPQTVLGFKHLIDLSLWGNKLTDLPDALGRLQHLERLTLQYNQISALPAAIGRLLNLTDLYLDFNQLSELPEQIAGLKKLKRLGLSENQLTSLPREILRLGNLEVLDLDGNPLNQPPPEIADQGVKAVFEYLRQLPEEATELNEAKMLLVGAGGVGKTCLAKRLMYGNFQHEESTRGIDIHKWVVSAPDDEGQEIKLNVWDFGGQEIYHATHQFFLTKRSVYLLVWNARKAKDYEHIHYWLHTVDAFGGKSPIILVMTKQNERDDELNMRDLKGKFPQVVGLYKVDNKDGRGIPALQDVIRDTTWELPHMRTPWVGAWFRVRERLEGDDRNWIHYGAFQGICRDEGLDDGQIDILGEYLHDLGIIIHFRDNLSLQDMVILKPEWATQPVYQILDTPSVRERGGVLLHSELAKIWDKADYPATLFPNLLELMNAFELAYELPDGKSHLVAELLPSSEPDYDWEHGDSLHFYYNYDFLPGSVTTRFIVRVHPDLETGPDGMPTCWREGAILHWEGARALVRARPVERLIEINIAGRKQRELLAVIRSHFGHIHRSIKNVKITQEIPCNCSDSCTHRFNYAQLLSAEAKGRDSVDCPVTWNVVSLSKLLDGYERKADRAGRHRKAGRAQPIQVIIDQSKEETIVEKVIYIGDRAQISAPVIIADTIESSFNQLTEAELDPEIKQLLDQLLKEIVEINKQVPPEQAEDAAAMARDAEVLVKEATSPKPRRKWYEVSVEGLIQAAENIGQIAKPVLDIVLQLKPLLLP
jgi:small GTP-binding protein